MTIKINLLPRRPRIDIKIFLVVLIVAISILLLWHIFLQQKIAVAGKYKSDLRQELSALIVPIHNDTNITKEQWARQQLAKNITNLEQKRAGFVQFFAMLHQGVSKNLYLTQMLIKNLKVKIVGHTRSVSDLMSLVTKLAAYERGGETASIQKITKQNDGYDFVLLSTIKTV